MISDHFPVHRLGTGIQILTFSHLWRCSFFRLPYKPLSSCIFVSYFDENLWETAKGTAITALMSLFSRVGSMSSVYMMTSNRIFFLVCSICRKRPRSTRSSSIPPKPKAAFIISMSAWIACLCWCVLIKTLYICFSCVIRDLSLYGDTSLFLMYIYHVGAYICWCNVAKGSENPRSL